MPRSLLEILLEKKDPKKSLPYPTRDQFNTELNNLDSICTSTLTEAFGLQGFGGVNTFKGIGKKLKDCQVILRKYKKEYQDYPWEDPTVQARLVDIRKEIMGEDPDKIGGLLLDLQEARIESLGEEDSYRIANTYFETADSLRVSGTQRILKIATMRDNEKKVNRARANTDLTENNEINKQKYDITAKKIGAEESDRPKDMPDSEWEIRKTEIAADNEKRRQDVIRLRMGIFYYLGNLLGESDEKVKEKWGGGEDGETEDPDPVKLEKQKAYRLELLQKAMPFIEKVTEKDFDDDDPIGDTEYINYIMVLASYTPGYIDFVPDPKEEVKEVEITEEQYVVIETEMISRKKEINALIDLVKSKHLGNGPIDKIITEEMEKAQADLKSVAPKNACDVNSKRKLKKAKKDLADKVNANKGVLTDDDIKDLGKVADIIVGILSYCNNEEYITKEDKK
jgi:hypothetical protein